jgi:hypothetical protein
MIETSTFGSKFVALKIATKMLQGLCYKLRMMGIPISGPSYIYCNNNSAVINSSSPASTFKKKSNLIAYHCVRGSMVKDNQWVACESTPTNLADLMTKPLNGDMQHDFLVFKSSPCHHTRQANDLTSYLGFAFLKVSPVSHRYLTKSNNTHALPEFITNE